MSGNSCARSTLVAAGGRKLPKSRGVAAFLGTRLPGSQKRRRGKFSICEAPFPRSADAPPDRHPTSVKGPTLRLRRMARPLLYGRADVTIPFGCIGLWHRIHTTGGCAPVDHRRHLLSQPAALQGPLRRLGPGRGDHATPGAGRSGTAVQTDGTRRGRSAVRNHGLYYLRTSTGSAGFRTRVGSAALEGAFQTGWREFLKKPRHERRRELWWLLRLTGRRRLALRAPPENRRTEPRMNATVPSSPTAEGVVSR
jgi:hypothetical protein